MLACTRRDNLYCQQVIKTNSFTSYQTGQTFKIFHQLNCKSYGLIYLLQCQIRHLQYVVKANWFQFTPQQSLKNSKTKNAIIGCKHFQTSNHNFQRHAKLTITEKITKLATTQPLRLILKNEKTFGFSS